MGAGIEVCFEVVVEKPVGLDGYFAPGLLVDLVLHRYRGVAEAEEDSGDGSVELESPIDIAWRGF